MRNLKKFLALALAMVMTFSLMLTVSAADPAEPKNFSDKNAISAKYAEAVNVLSALKVIQGDEGGFRPADPISRAEVATMIYRIATSVDDTQAKIYKDYPYFGDVDADDWFAGYVNFCGNAQYIKGVGDNMFDPYANVTGYEVLAMILRIVGYDQNGEFTGPTWHIQTAAQARLLGITKNISEGTLGAPATREMVAEILFQALLVPTVKYNMLNGYVPEVLVARQSNTNGYIYDEDVHNTLMYAKFDIVGKRTILGIDNYGRPVEQWMKDSDADTVAGGSKYVVNYEAPVEFKAVNSATVTLGAVHCWKIDGATQGASYNWADEVALEIPLSAVNVFYDSITECELTKAINKDKSINWENITEYVNGGLVESRDDGAGDKEVLDKLHTTNTGTAGKSDYTIGAKGRTTEIYKYTVPETAADGTPTGKTVTKWTFVYIDTMLGEVEKVVPKTVDTAGHTVKAAELWIAVNDDIKGDDAIVIKNEDDENFTQKKGDKVLLNTWGLKDDTDTVSTNKVNSPAVIGDSNAGDTITVNEYILNAVPDDTKDTDTTDKDGTALNLWSAYQTVTKNSAGEITGKEWAVDLASENVGENATVPTTTVNVNATLGFSADKTGIISDGKNIYTTWAYHVDQPAKDDTHTDADFAGDGSVGVDDDTVLNKLHVVVTNEIIGQTYTAALDRHGNIVGMWQDKSDKIIGVVTDVDYVRIGLGKYAVEMEVFTTESKTETVRLLDASNNNDYFPTQDDADVAIVDDSNDKLGLTFTDDGTAGGTDSDLNPKGALLELTSYTKDGATYWRVTDSCTSTTDAGTINSNPKMAGTQDTDGIVKPGEADTLVGQDANNHDDIQVNEETLFFVAEYDFRYNTGAGNQGSNINVRYKVYNSFRDIPVIDGAYGGPPADTFNIVFQALDGKVDATTKEAKYVLITAIDPNEKYTQSNPKTINPDDSFLVVAPIATYAEYSEYSVAKNGGLTTIKVANVNGTVNKDLQDAIRTKGLLVATSTNSAGYITAVDEVKDIDTATNPNLAGKTDTLIPAGKGLRHSKGVLGWDADWDGTEANYDADNFLTVAKDCVVKIVNVDNGQLYPATLDHVKQYQDHAIVFDVDVNGWVSCLYIID